MRPRTGTRFPSSHPPRVGTTSGEHNLAATMPSQVETEPASRRLGEGEPMLLVHGITDTFRTWELLQPRLASHHDTLAITLLGHSGGKPLDGDTTSLRELVDEAERDMDAAGFETAHLVGNSLGGWIVLE